MPNLSPTELSRLEAVRAQVRAMEAALCPGQSLPFGVPEIDQRLAGGLPIAALHEATGTTRELNDDAAATLFVAGIAARRATAADTVLWVLARRDLFAPALAQAGLLPGQVIYAECRRDEEALAVMEEGLRHGSLAAVVGEIGRAPMAATRRLQLAAENSGTTALMLKRCRQGRDDPLAPLSAAVTRWRIGCVPSQALPVSGIARPRWKIELVRQRGGPPHQWIMEGVNEAGRLALPAEPSHGPAAADRWEAAVRHVA